MRTIMPTKEYLNEIFDYSCGRLIWKKCKMKSRIGFDAGSINSHGYLQVYINGKPYKNHRIVYAYHFGNEYVDKYDIDHIDGDRLNNKIANLRLVTKTENTWNRSKAKGYWFNKKAKKYQSEISVNGSKVYLGYFDTENDAREAYLNAKDELHTINIRG